MLPFMKPKKMAATIIANHTKDGKVEKSVEGEHHHELMAASEDLISAVHNKDAHKVSSALKRAHIHMMEQHAPKEE